jgi:hypothetical protein
VLLFKHWGDYTTVWWTAITLEGHLATAPLDGICKTVVVSRGCSQGNVLLPLLWFLLYYLIARLNVGGIHTQGDADDICLLPMGKLPNEMWCDKVGLLVNPDKTRLVVYTRKKKSPSFFEIRLFGVTLHYFMSVKYPTVVLNSQLTMRVCLDVRTRKAHNLLWTCRRACGVTRGLRHKVVHWLYISIIRSPITFAPLVWWPGCQTASGMKRLSRMQTCMLRGDGSDVHHSN